MGMFSKRIKRILNRDKSLTRYVRVPYLYPMGAMTFAIACSHCKNMGSSKCTDCKSEVKSGFESKFPLHSDKNLCVSCGAEIPEGYHVCSSCQKKGE